MQQVEPTQSEIRHTLCHVGLLLAVAITVFFTNLGAAKLWDRDEPRNAGCAVEMLQRNDWVTPYFNGELRTHKPVLTYWLMMAAYSLFGVNEFSARFWSAAMGVGTTLCAYGMGRRLFSPAVGLWSALAICTSLMFCVASRAATPDAGLIFFSTLSITTFVLGTFRPKAHSEAAEPPQTWRPGQFFPSWPVAALMYGFMGVAMLAKGPVGMILPTAVIGMFLLLMRLPRVEKRKLDATTQQTKSWSAWRIAALMATLVGLLFLDRTFGSMKLFAVIAVCAVVYGMIRRESLAARLIRPFFPKHFLGTCWQMRPITAVIIALAVALPWYIWVGVRTDGAWLRGFFLEHNLGRATQSFEGHRGSFLFYPISALVGCFPWSILLIPAVAALVRAVRRREKWMVGYLFVACWAGVYIAAFSLAQTKLPSYITPAYPALAMMIGAFVVRWRQNSELVPKWTPRVSFGALIGGGVILSIALPIAAAYFFPGDQWLGLIGLIPIIGGCCGIYFSECRQPSRAAISLAASAVLLMICAFGMLTVRASEHQHIRQLLAEINSTSSQARIAAHAAHEPSWVFYAGKTIPVINSLDSNQIEEHFLDPDAFLLTTNRALPALQSHLPPDIKPIAQERFFLKKYDLVVLGRTKEGVLAAQPMPKLESFVDAAGSSC